MKMQVMALLATFVAPVGADDGNWVGRLDPAWREMENRAARLLGVDGQRQLLDMAYAQVAVDACPGLSLRNPAYEDGFHRLAGGGVRDAAAQRKFENEMMTYFGVYTGLVLAESFLDKAAFCRDVDGIRRASRGPGRFWIVR